MILTVTPNPALDYTIRIDAFEPGRRGRYRDARYDPAGKGINVSRMVRRLGGKTLALGFAAGETGALLAGRLDAEGVPHDLIPAGGLTRVNVTLITGTTGTATHLHGTGDGVGESDTARLLDRVSARLPGASVLVISGSLPPGMPDEACADLVRAARAAGVPAIVDVEGPPLAAALRAGPALVKPNRLEAERHARRPLPDQAGRLALLEAVCREGASMAVMTLGGEGALGVRAGEAWSAALRVPEPVRAVGAGDSFAAGLALALSEAAPFGEALRRGTAAGAATALVAGTGLGTREDAERLLGDVLLRRLR
jgi:1-phosphofructokinase family hexose kinase